MKKKNQKSIADLIPVVTYDEELECLRLKNGRFLDIVQINSKDLVNSSKSELDYDLMKFSKLYRLYEADLKLVVLNFPCDTSKQQECIRHKLEQTSNAAFQYFLKKRLKELIRIEKQNTTREFYYFVFADKAEELQRNILTLKSVLHLGKDGLLILLSKEKKQQILHRINNKNSMLVD